MHPAYAEALQSAPEFEWALARVRSFVQDVEWDPRLMARAPRLNPDGSFFNKWTQGTLIDVGLSMEDFVRDSLSLQQPFASFAGVAPSVRRLIGRIAAQGTGIAAARADTAAAMIDVAWRLVPLSSRLVDRFMPRHALTVAGHLNVAFLEVVSRAIESPAPFVVEDMLFGFGVRGVIFPHGFFRPIVEGPPGAFARTNEEYLGDVRKLLEGQWRRPDQRDELTQLWRSTVAEVDSGYMRGPFSERQLHDQYGRFAWRCMIRFAVWQGKLRPCDNAAHSGHNSSTQCAETIVCTTAEWPIQAAVAFYEEGVVDLQGGTDDVNSAYRKVVNGEPEYTIIALIDPQTGKVSFFQVPGFNFGLKSAVLAFNTVMELTTEALRRIYDVACVHFYDDVCTVDPTYAGTSGQDCLWSFHDMIRLELAIKKHVSMFPRFKFLGCISDFSMLRELGRLYLRVCPERKVKVLQVLHDILFSGALSPAASARIKGKVFFTSLQSWGRGGRAALQEFTVRQYKKYGSDELTVGLASAVEFLTRFIPVLPPATWHLAPSERSDGLPLLVWTDAMYERVKAIPSGSIATAYVSAFDEVSGEWFYVARAVLSITVCDRRLDDAGVVHCAWSHSRLDVGIEVLRHFVPGKKTYIGALEALAGAAFYYSYSPGRLKGRQIYHWIDNVAAVAGLCKGYSGKEDAARIVNSFNVRQTFLLFRVWWEWIPSEQNIADLPSRWTDDKLISGEFVEILPGILSSFIPFVLPPFQSLLAPLDVCYPRAGKRGRGKRGGRQGVA
jgi:hypothetical protein